MTQEIWTAVDRFIGGHLALEDAVLTAALDASKAAGLPPINVSAAQGKLLHVLAKLAGARHILEIGTLGGYSTIWLGRALPQDGRLISLEAEPKHAEVARANLARAGLGDVAEVRLGKALDTLPRLVEEQAGPFDLVFIDADKANIPEYFAWSLKLARPGAAILIDNVVRGGKLADPGAAAEQADIRGVRRLHEILAQESQVTATTVQTVGAKGYDGFTLATVIG